MPTSAAPDADAPTLRWTVHPAAREPGRAAGVVVIVGAAGLFAFGVSGSAALALATIAALGLALRPFFLPRTYVLDARGAREAGPLQGARQLAWSEVRSVRRERHGVHLSPLHATPRLLPDRGIFLRTDGNLEDVARFALARRSAP